MIAGRLAYPAQRRLRSDLRRRCRELLRAEIGQTVAQDADIDDELRELFTAVGT